MVFFVYSKDNCDILPLPGNLNTIPISFAISKDHYLHDRLTRAMLHIANDGRLNKILRDYDRFLCDTSAAEPQAPKSLNVEDFAGLFFVVGIKLGCALLWGFTKKAMRKWKVSIGNESNRAEVSLEQRKPEK